MKVNFKNAFSKKKVAIILTVFVLIAVMIISNPDIKDFFSAKDAIKLTFQTGVEYDMVSYGKDMLLVNNESIFAVDKSGREAWSIVAPTATPYTQVSGDYIMLADINGKTLKTFKKEKVITQLETENKIICAKVNNNGNIAVATDQLGYKGMVTLYNKNGKEVFKWHSGSGYIGDIDISSKKRIAVAQIMTDKEKVYSKIVSINPGSDKEPETIAEVEGIVMKLKYRDNGKLVAMSDKGVFCFKKSGKLDFSTDFGGRIPSKCNIENENNMVFAFDSGQNSTILESYSASGKLRGSFDAKSEVSSMDVNGECIVAVKRDSIVRINPKGVVKEEIKANKDVKGIRIFQNRSKILVVGDRNAELIKIR